MPGSTLATLPHPFREKEDAPHDALRVPPGQSRSGTPVTTVQVCHRDNGTIGVRFPYNREVVDLLKGTVPARARSWDPNASVWTLTADTWLPDLVAALEAAGHRVVTVGEPRQKRQKPTQRTRTAEIGWADAVFSAVGPTRHKAVFRALTSVLHPDRPDTGDRALFEALESARRKAGQ